MTIIITIIVITTIVITTNITIDITVRYCYKPLGRLLAEKRPVPPAPEQANSILRFNVMFYYIIFYYIIFYM